MAKFPLNDFLRTSLSLTSQYNDSLYFYLGTLGYTGSLADRMKQWDDSLAAPSLSINDITVAEDALTATFTVTKTGAGACSVDWATAAGVSHPATAGSDYTTASGTLNFLTGDTTKSIDITITSTADYEFTEEFVVNLSNPVDCTISDAQGIASLTDVSGFPTADSVSSPTITEGIDLVFTVTFPTLAEFTVNHPFSLTGTAVDAVHFDSTPLLSVGSIVFGDIVVPPNTASLTMTFTTFDTGSGDGDKTVILTVDGNVGTGTISDTAAAAGPLDTATNSFVTADAGSGVMTITDGIGAATPTFTRSTTAATRLASGLWKLDVAVNSARSYYDESLSFDGFLCEPAATQLLTAGSTRDLTNAAWATNTTMTVAKDQTGIDGVVNAASSLTATGSDSIMGQTITAAASSRTFSAFVKRITGTGVVTLQQVGGTTTALDITSLINSSTWTQVELNATQLNAICEFKLATSGDAIAVDCTQFEAGIKATTPIPSGGTRGADLLATGLLFNTGSYLATWKPFNAAVNAGILLGSSYSGGTFVFMRAISTTTMQCHDGTATKVPVTVSARTNKTQYSTALRASGSTISGAEGGVLGAGETFDGSFNGYAMAIGNRTGASSVPFHGTIKDVYVWNTVDLTDLELQEVTGTPPLPTITSVTATNQDEGTTATFTVTLSGAYGSAVAYTYALSGTAVAGTNFTNSPTVSGSSSIGGGNLTVATGESVVTISYPTIHDFIASAALTLIATVAGTAATSTIFDIDTSGDSGTVFAATANFIEDTTTTDTLNINELAVGEVYVVPPNGTYTATKTVHKVGAAVSDVFSQSRGGYVTLSGTDAAGDKIRIGNANLNLPAGHALGMLVRIDKDDLTGYTGRINLLKTTQTDGTNVLMTLFIGGHTYATSAYRGQPVIQRAGQPAGVPGLMTESGTSNNAWGNLPYIWASGANPTPQWAWIWAYGKSAADTSTNLQTQTYNGGSTNFQPSNTLGLVQALHGIGKSTLQLNMRKVSTPTYGATAITPEDLTNVDFVLASASDTTAKSIDIARVIKLSQAPTLYQIAAMCGGEHPLQMGLMSGDDFCIDFNSLPSICTVIQGTPTYNTAEDSPILTRYHGDNTTDLALVITNGRVA